MAVRSKPQGQGSWLTYPRTRGQFLKLLVTMLAFGLVGFGLAYLAANFDFTPNPPQADGPSAAIIAPCGDGICNAQAGENCNTCSKDCCPGPAPTDEPPPPGCNNNGICEPPHEGTFNCGDCPNFCGDSICAASEIDSCCGDGKDCTVAVTCGDGICSACENTENCSKDCQQATEEPTVPPTDPPPTEPPPDDPGPQETEEVVETEEPTQEPTDEPTDTPTDEPSDTPTEEPDEPTQEATAEPTEEPENQGPPPFVIPLLVLLGLGGMGIFLFFLFFRRRKNEDDDEEAPE